MWKCLHYDISSDSIYCHTCVNATYSRNLVKPPHKQQPFVNFGFKTFRDATRLINKHVNSDPHKNCEEKLMNIEKTPIYETFDLVSEENQRRAKKYLGVLFSSVKFLTQQGFPLRGHEHHDGSLYNLMKERVHHDHPDLIDLLDVGHERQFVIRYDSE